MQHNMIKIWVSCAVSAAVLGMFSSAIYAEDTAREKVIRDKALAGR